jgi:hypothetical protein
MSHATYHINHSFQYKIVEFFASIGLISTVFPRERKKSSGTGIIVWVNKILKKELVYTEKEKLHAGELSKKEAAEEHIYAEKELKNCKRLYNQLEKSNFFGNPETRQICENLLSTCFDIEAILRVKAFSDVHVPEDKSLNEIASHVSLSSLR